MLVTLAVRKTTFSSRCAVRRCPRFAEEQTNQKGSFDPGAEYYKGTGPFAQATGSLYKLKGTPAMPQKAHSSVDFRVRKGVFSQAAHGGHILRDIWRGSTLWGTFLPGTGSWRAHTLLPKKWSILKREREREIWWCILDTFPLAVLGANILLHNLRALALVFTERVFFTWLGRAVMYIQHNKEGVINSV